MRELPAHKRRFHFYYAGLKPPVDCRVIWKTVAGEAIRRSSLHLRQNKEFVEITSYFAAGSYGLELKFPSGRRIHGTFEVTGSESEAPVVIRLQ